MIPVRERGKKELLFSFSIAQDFFEEKLNVTCHACIHDSFLQRALSSQGMKITSYSNNSLAPLSFLVFTSLTPVTGPSPKVTRVSVGDERINLGHIHQVDNPESSTAHLRDSLDTRFCRKAQSCEDPRGHPSKQQKFCFCFSHLRW